MGDDSADLVTICQALHWCDIPGFYREVGRMLRPGGVLAVLGYHFTRPAPEQRGAAEMTRCMEEVYGRTRPYWTHHREMVDRGYRTLPPLPWDSVREDGHYAEMEASLADWAG